MALLLLADAATPAPSIDLNVLWQQLIANSPLAGVLFYLLRRVLNRSDAQADSVLAAFTAQAKATEQMGEAVRNSCRAPRSENSSPSIPLRPAPSQ